jgi:hypothetical protein
VLIEALRQSNQQQPKREDAEQHGSFTQRQKNWGARKGNFSLGNYFMVFAFCFCFQEIGSAITRS